MKANSKKGLARKGNRKQTITFIKNNGVAYSTNEKVTKTKIFVRNITKISNRFQAALDKYFPNYDNKEEQLKKYRKQRFIFKNPVIIQAFKAL